MLKTLKGRMSLVYLGLVCLIAFLGAISVTNMVVLQKSINGLMTENYKSISAMASARDALNKEENAAIIYVNLNDTNAINLFYDNNKIFLKYYDIEANNITENGEQKLINQISENYNTLLKTFSKLQNIRDTQGSPAALLYYNQQIQPIITKIHQNIDDITILNQNAMLNKKNETSNNAEVSIYTLLIISFIAVVGGLILSWYFVNRFLHPIHLLTEGISRVRAGELNIKLNLKTNDEAGKLVYEFNEMTQRLSSYDKSTLGTLMEERNKSVAIVKSISDPLIVLDRNYKVVMANNACERFFGFMEVDVLDKHFLEAVRNGELFNFITESVEKGDIHSEKIMNFMNEKEYFFGVGVTQIRDTDDIATGYIVLMQNVTGLKELERTKTDFVATVSHEFKTPLTSIIMGASMLEGGNLGILNGEQMDVVKAVIEDGERLSGFVSELLEISKLESGKAVYSFVPCSLSAIVESSVRQFAETAGRQNVTVNNDVDEDLPPIYADFERITWVMNNLLSNALKYTKAGDYITISARIKDNMIETSVKDTGDGIPPDYLDRIFDKYVQVKGHDIELRGTGLGLAVAKEIVTAHQGQISVESEMDAGSDFKFTLPLYKA
jgi:PAS domain S-box-containing protein